MSLTLKGSFSCCSDLSHQIKTSRQSMAQHCSMPNWTSAGHVCHLKMDWFLYCTITLIIAHRSNCAPLMKINQNVESSLSNVQSDQTEQLCLAFNESDEDLQQDHICPQISEQSTGIPRQTDENTQLVSLDIQNKYEYDKYSNFDGYNDCDDYSYDDLVEKEVYDAATVSKRLYTSSII